MKKEALKVKDNFTVAELIEKLKALPQDLPVFTSGYESGYENLHPPKVIQLTHKPESKYWDGEFQTLEKKDEQTFDTVVLERIMRND